MSDRPGVGSETDRLNFEVVTQYQFGKISIDKYGRYSLSWFGMHADQGGMTERWGTVTFETLEDLSHGIAMMGTFNQHDARMELVRAKEKLKEEAKDRGPVLSGDGTSTPQGA